MLNNIEPSQQFIVDNFTCIYVSLTKCTTTGRSVRHISTTQRLRLKQRERKRKRIHLIYLESISFDVHGEYVGCDVTGNLYTRQPSTSREKIEKEEEHKMMANENFGKAATMDVCV